MNEGGPRNENTRNKTPKRTLGIILGNLIRDTYNALLALLVIKCLISIISNKCNALLVL